MAIGVIRGQSKRRAASVVSGINRLTGMARPHLGPLSRSEEIGPGGQRSRSAKLGQPQLAASHPLRIDPLRDFPAGARAGSCRSDCCHGRDRPDLFRTSQAAFRSPLSDVLAPAGIVVFVGLLGMSFPHPFRGLVQRVAETIIFGRIVLVGWWVYRAGGSG